MKEATKQTGPPVDSINIKIGTSEIVLPRKDPASVFITFQYTGYLL